MNLGDNPIRKTKNRPLTELIIKGDGNKLNRGDTT